MRTSPLLAAIAATALLAGCNARPATNAAPLTLDAQLRADMNFLASDELQGRGSATRDEHLAALYCGSQLQSLGLEPGGSDGTFVQRIPLPTPLPRNVAMRIGRNSEESRVETWNAIGILRGADPKLKDQVILLSSHLDHLGMSRAPATTRPAGTPAPDLIYNGADDDASGTCAVLAMARHLAAQRPARTVVFAMFGSEEMGMYGDKGFLDHPPVPLKSIVANLEFEMIGRPDSSVPDGTLWLTGYERSNLGPTLAQHGARLVQDPHPEQHFFERSDNISLARMGIVAHTVSSFGLHKDYHQPSDEISTIDFPHMAKAIRSMQPPIAWLTSSDFTPTWNPNGQPESPAPRRRNPG